MIILLLVILFAFGAPLLTKPITIDHNKEIVFGQSGMFTGSMALYGKTIKDGINACFKRVNEQGGIRGKRLRLVSLDDKGEIEQAQKNVAMMRDQGITMFLGSMGTSRVLALESELRNQELAMFFPWGGDARLRDSSLSTVVNGPGYMEPQLMMLADHIEYKIGHRRVAIIHADDTFSTNAALDMATLLRQRNRDPLAITYYNRFTLDVERGAKDLLAVDPRIIICIGTSVPIVKLINHLFEEGHYAITFLGIDSTLFVANKLKGKGVPFYYTSAMPDPTKSKALLATEYLRDIAAYVPDETPNELSFSYYVSAALIVDAIKKIAGPITHRSIMQNLESMKDYDLKGIRVNFDPKTRHMYGQDVYMIKG